MKRGTPVAFAKLRCTFKRQGKVVTLPFPECSVADLRAAIALARGNGAEPAHKSPEARAVAAALKKSGSKEVTFTLSKQALTLRLPLADLVQVAKALTAYQAPTPE
jgi:hypothetical protein